MITTCVVHLQKASIARMLYKWYAIEELKCFNICRNVWEDLVSSLEKVKQDETGTFLNGYKNEKWIAESLKNLDTRRPNEKLAVALEYANYRQWVRYLLVFISQELINVQLSWACLVHLAGVCWIFLYNRHSLLQILPFILNAWWETHGKVLPVLKHNCTR